MTRVLGALCTFGAAATTAVTMLACPPASAAAPVDLMPAQLERGADVRLPHLQGGDVVDGQRRVDVPGRFPTLLGRSPGGYVVVSLVGGTWKTLRVSDTYPTKVLARGTTSEDVVLADDGFKVAVTRSASRTRAVIDVVATRSGTRVRRGVFAGYPRVLDLDGRRAVVGGPDGASRWNLRTGRTVAFDSGFVYRADLSSNRVASFEKDPYQGGCTSLSTLRAPRDLLWKSCREEVREFSPHGHRMVTQPKLTDGLGPTRLWQRTAQGRLLASYRVGHHFGRVAWESWRTLLLDTYGNRTWAVVRCTGSDCERASRLRPTP